MNWDSFKATLRRIQQSYLFHLAVAGGFSALTTYFTCHPEAQTQSCMEVAIGVFLGTFGISIQHSPGSASFKNNGQPIPAVPKLKEMADNVVKIQEAAKDPNVTTVNQSDANKAINTIDKISSEVALNNAIIKTTLANAVVEDGVSK